MAKLAKLSPAVLATADRSHVVSAMAMVAKAKPAAWFSAQHPVATGGLNLKWNKAPSAARVVEGIAVSAPTHCVDGWGFASRALSALIAGDNHAARHMAYYAQLRAGLSILANLGVGIFDGFNVIVDSQGNFKRLDPAEKLTDRGMGTHAIVWLALKEWANTPATAEIFLDLVRFRGASLKEVLLDIWPGLPKVGAAGSLIEAWGLDLKTGLDERRHRNISSYAPQALNPLSAPVGSTLRFLDHAWTLFEPSASGSFDTLDRHLLRNILWKQSAITEPQTALEAGSLHKQYSQLSSGIRSLVSEDFLLGKVEPTKLELLRIAEAKVSPPSPLHMIARSLLLLRMATSFTQATLTEAGVDRAGGDLRPWLDELGDSRGFWTSAAPLEDVQDLWLDTELALDDLSKIRKNSPTSLTDWRSYGFGGLPVLAEAERIAMWSFCR